MPSTGNTGGPRNRGRHSISEAISVSLGLQNTNTPRDHHDGNHSNPYDSQNDQFMSPRNNYLGRSYVSGFLSCSPYGSNSLESDRLPIARMRTKSIHAAKNLHRQTAKLCEDFNEPNVEDNNIQDYVSATEEPRPMEISDVERMYDQEDELRNPVHVNTEDRGDDIEDVYESLVTGAHGGYRAIPTSPGGGLRTSSRSALWRQFMSSSSKLVHYLPATILGLLLNVLDGLSYGMIIFPITEPIFSHLGPSGLSMFYVSTIISQVIYSSGFSNFPTGVGSEMIEVTPFFHSMALAIKDALPGRDDEILTTTIFCYVISSLVTGLTFYVLGKMKLGKIVGFFPRHILIGCIGGVGYFLVVTGLEVTTRVAKLEYTWPFISHMFTDVSTLVKWVLPVLLTVLLIVTQRHFQNSLVLPTFYIATLVAFHFVVAIIPNVSLGKLRNMGWIFPVAASKDQWYDHYKLFQPHRVHWGLIAKQAPTMLALSFFGILHVPINVPALAISLQMDKYDVDKELIAHGYSNLLSGALGSIQNYLVYTNSLLFIRAGADSAMAGYLLAFLTFIMMVIGPVIISYIPICIVGSLIFLLGYELLYEALIETRGKVTNFEYITICIIVLTMGIFDFVLGVIVGILIACFSFLVDSTKLQTINGEYDGKIAKSTVYRDYVQSRFLDGIGEQIYVLKLQSLLFFGTIISIEEKINKLLEISDDQKNSKRRIKCLILDLKNINADNIDYSAAEGFNRIKRFTQSKHIQLIISSISETDHIYTAFSKVKLLDDVELFGDLNGALEWCENELLFKYKELRAKARDRLQNKMQMANLAANNDSKAIDGVPKSHHMQNLMSLPFNTPRNDQMLSVAQRVFKNEQKTVDSLKVNYKELPPVLPLLLFALKPYRPGILSEDTNVKNSELELWSKLCPYFSRRRLASQSILLHNSDIFFVMETGILKIVYDLPQGIVYESLSNRTCYGIVLNPGTRPCSESKVTIKTETEVVLWVIDSSILARLKQENLSLYTELILLIATVKEQRYRQILGYTLVSA